jgi:type IV pilus assembly protein PilX
MRNRIKTRIKNLPPCHSKQRGVVLILALVILTLITLTAVSGMEMTSGDAKMATQFFERETALQAAEAALIEAEVWLQAQERAPLAQDVTDDRVLAFDQYDVFRPEAWNDTNAAAVVNVALSDRAHYLIEQRSSVSDGSVQSPDVSSTRVGATATETIFYRITARGKARDGTTEVFLQSHYLLQSEQ